MFVDHPLSTVHVIDLPADPTVPADAIAGVESVDAVRGGDEPTLVLLHGFTCDHRLMTGAFEGVPGIRRLRRIYLDLPGHGLSKAADELQGTDDVLTVVRDVLAQLVPDGSVLLAGASWGGYLVQGLIAAEPHRYAGICLLAPATRARHADRELPDHRVLVDELGLPDADVTGPLELAVVRSAEVHRRGELEITPGLRLCNQVVAQRISDNYPGSWDASAVPFDGPGLLIAGRQDSGVGYADQLRRMASWPRTTCVVLDTAGHNPHLDQPALTTALIADWVVRARRELDRRP